MMDRKFYSGSNLDQALMKASRDLGIPKEEISYRQIEKKHGFLKMRRSIVIEVDPTARNEAPESVPAVPESAAPVEEAPVAEALAPEEAASELAPPVEVEAEIEAEPAPPADIAVSEPGDVPPAPVPRQHESRPQAEGEIPDAIRESLDMLLDLAGVDMESSIEQGDERYEVELWGADEDTLLRDNGRPLLSLQHLLVRLVRGKTGEAVYCRVDCDQFHEIREERLRDLAQRVASEVTAQHRSRLLESMAPDERRIVHMTLANDPHVETESQGNGYFKRVKIFPL